jgi:beta-lactamase class A
MTRVEAGVTDRLQEAFSAAAVTGLLHVRDIDGDAEAGLRADEPVVTASVFKIPVALELARRAADGDLDLTERVRVGAGDRTIGPTGLSRMSDEVELSLRDLAHLMMTISDNTATDVLMRRLGTARINETLKSLGLDQTVLVGDCQILLSSLAEDLGIDLETPVDLNEIDPKLFESARTLRAEETTRTTPREMTGLLQMIWLDKAGPPEACAEVRRLMGLQFAPHRFSSAFPDGIQLSAKTGTLPGIRNEAGVVEYPDGGRYAAAVFTVAGHFEWRNPEADRVVGTAASIAVEQLRKESI